MCNLPFGYSQPDSLGVVGQYVNSLLPKHRIEVWKGRLPALCLEAIRLWHFTIRHNVISSMVHLLGVDNMRTDI